MSQENESLPPETWNWHSDSQGRILSVSTGFSSIFGIAASKTIIGQFFWTFAEGNEQPSTGWFNLEKDFKNHNKIKKFIFHYHVQGQKLKIAISGEPVYEKNKYLGHRGIGYLADYDDISIPDISENMLSVSLENLDIGIAILSLDTGLIDFNQNFVKQMRDAKVNVFRNIPYATLIKSLETHNILSKELSYDYGENACFYYEKPNKSFISFKKSALKDNLILIKTEEDRALFNRIDIYKKDILQLKNNNNTLELRIRDYKDKLSHLFDKKANTYVSQDTDLKKILEFYENNLDVGILVTNINGDIETANYYIAQIFGYMTASMLILNHNHGEFQNYLNEHKKRITDLSDNSLNRFEHILDLNNFMYQGNVKEVITFYPSVHNPQKVISLFYPQENDSDISHNHDETYQSENALYNEFIFYMVNDIKSSLNVINGYNDLQISNSQNTHKYNQEINQSCHHILSSIADVMEVHKLASKVDNLKQSIISCEAVISECLEKLNPSIREKNIDLQCDIQNMGLFFISDKNLFANALTKILDYSIRLSPVSSSLKIKIVENLELQKINIIIADEAKYDVEKISNLHINTVFNDSTARATGNLNFKIAENYLHFLGCKFTVTSHTDLGNTFNLEISGDMVTSSHQRDSNNIVI